MMPFGTLFSPKDAQTGESMLIQLFAGALDLSADIFVSHYIGA
jgi:hypothetical protein